MWRSEHTLVFTSTLMQSAHRKGTRWLINPCWVKPHPQLNSRWVSTCGHIYKISLTCEIQCDDIFGTPCTQTKAPVLIFPNVLCRVKMTRLPFLFCWVWVLCHHFLVQGGIFFLCDVTFLHYSSECMKTRNLTVSWDSQIWCWHLTHTPKVKSIYRARGEAPTASSITIQVKQVTRPSRDSNAPHLRLTSL